MAAEAVRIASNGSMSYWLLAGEVYRLHEYEAVRFDTRGLPLGARWECAKWQFDAYRDVIVGSSI
jgi:hypothetical protein